MASVCLETIQSVQPRENIRDVNTTHVVNCHRHKIVFYCHFRKMDQITSVQEQNARNVRFNQHILYRFIIYDDNVIMNAIASVITRFESVRLLSLIHCTSIWQRSIHSLLKIRFLPVLSHVFINNINKLKCSVEQSRTACVQVRGQCIFQG